MEMHAFNYNEAFSRNIGLVTEREQQRLRTKKVAIAGLGGVGGTHLITLARLGIGQFHIADFDNFGLVNFNRQTGAAMSTVEQPKIAILEKMARDINPSLVLTPFGEGVSDATIDGFLKGVDLYVDGLDFFVLDIRAKIFKRCHELGIPAITAGPIGMGTAYITFMPDAMSFEEYFRLEGLSTEQQYINFLLGLTPKALHRQYVVDPSRVRLDEKRGPSTAMACNLCAGIVGIEALKILLQRGRVYAAPYHQLFDGFTNRFVRGKLRGGARNPFHRIKLKFAYAMIRKQSLRISEMDQAATPKIYDRVIEQVLDMARWAPSGDNEQPWRFHIIDDHTVRIRLTWHHGKNIYDFEGKPTLLAAGILLETMRIAASAQRYDLDFTYEGYQQPHQIITARLVKADVAPDALATYIPERSVDRKLHQTRKLNASDKHALADSLGPHYRIVWYEGTWRKLRCSLLNAAGSAIRLRTPEAHSVHHDVLDWKSAYSADKIPVSTLPLNPLSKQVLKWSLGAWNRAHLANRFGIGILGPQLEMDLMPGMFTGAHFAICATTPAKDSLEFIEFGRSLQRFWLTATSLGLVMQPSHSIIIFSDYGRHKVPFTSQPSVLHKAARFANNVPSVLGIADTDTLMFAGRMGYPKMPLTTSRSLRLPLDALIEPL